jgi:hypothetical protein
VRAQVRAEIKVNEQGVRGLYASEDIKKGKKILIIPGSCSLPLGLYEHAAIHVSVHLSSCCLAWHQLAVHLTVWMVAAQLVCSMAALIVSTWSHYPCCHPTAAAASSALHSAASGQHCGTRCGPAQQAITATCSCRRWQLS